MKRGAFAPFLVFASLTLLGCEIPGLKKSQSAIQVSSTQSITTSEDPKTTVDPVAVFKTSVYPSLRANCSGCHGAGQSPVFAGADSNQSYTISKGLVQFNDLQQSRFYRKVKDAHCGAACSTDGSAMLALLETWRDAETAPSSGGGSTGGSPTPTPSATEQPPQFALVTQALPLPIPLPTGSGWAQMRFPLNRVNPQEPALEAAFIEFEVQRFTVPSSASPGSYRFRKPKLAVPTDSVHVQDLKVLVNGRFNPIDTDFESVDQVVAPQPIPAYPSPLPFPVLSTDELIVLQDKAAGDLISVAFGKLEKRASTGCRSLALFQSNVRPVMANRCFGCHQNANQQGTRRFSMQGTDQEICDRSLQRVIRQNPLGSPLIQYPYNRLNGHSNTGMTSSEVNGFVNWIQAE